MRGRRLFFGVTLLVIGLFVGTALWISSTAAEQESRNQDLIMACQIGNADTVKTLLNQGADPNARDVTERPPTGFWDWLTRLVQPQQNAANLGATALACAARSRHPYDTTKLLIDHGADVKAPDSADGSVLFWAARAGDADLVQLLLDHGVDLNAPDSYGLSPLRGAILARSVKTVSVLLARGEIIRPADIVEANSERQPEVQRLLSQYARKK